MAAEEMYLDGEDAEEDFYWSDLPSEMEGMTMKELFNECAYPVIFGGGLNLVFMVVGVSALQGIIKSIKVFPDLVPLASSFLLGVVLLKKLLGWTLFGYACGLVALCLPLLRFKGSLPISRGSLVAAVSLSYILFSQCVVLEASTFLQFRGPMMIIAMKLISVAFDSDSFARGNDDGRNGVNLFRAVAYLFDCSTVVFGPWISFTQYCLIQESRNFMSPGSMFRCLLTLLLGLGCLLHSQCFISWLLPEDYNYSLSKWVGAYGTAQSFRFSHYFVSLISETSLLIVGSDVLDKTFSVAKPWKVEIPRSLVDVVVNWNRPMHEFLKRYVFGRGKRYGNFVAIFSTYAASSFLHGLNFQISAVLFSLGLYTYTEHVLREKLSRVYHCCIRSKSCEDECGHRFRKYHALTLLINVAFVLLAIFHLTYVGMVFNDEPGEAEKGYSWRHTIASWSDLNFLSHYVAIGMLVVAKCI